MATALQTGTFCWFDLPFEDQERAQKFYTELFGWKYEEFMEGTYFGIEGSRSDVAPENARMTGGMIKKMHPGHQILMYFAVPSCAQWCEKAEGLGGTVVAPEQQMGDFGSFAVIQDPEGNQIALWESAG